MQFLDEAAAIGVDGLITVDLPPEEDKERPAGKTGGSQLHRFVTPTSDEARLPKVLVEASGFVYYVSITGSLEQKAAGASIADAYDRIKR